MHTPPIQSSLRIALMTCVWLLAGISCSSLLPGKRQAPAASTEKKPSAVFQYTAAAGLAKKVIPSQVYLFPPLLSDAKGNPVQSLQPVLDDGGEIIDWRPSAGSPEALRRKMSERLRQIGYQVVDFKTVVNARQPYSILIVSSFYNAEATIKDAPAGGHDRSQLVMIKASVFDQDLDPRHKIDLMKVDGLLNYSSSQPLARPLERSFEETMRWFGDNVTGYTLLD